MADPVAPVDRLQRKLGVTQLRLIALATMAEARGSEARGSERLNWVTRGEARVLRLLKDRESPGAIAKCLAMDGKEVNEIITKVSKRLGIAKGDLPQWLRDSRDW